MSEGRNKENSYNLCPFNDREETAVYFMHLVRVETS